MKRICFVLGIIITGEFLWAAQGEAPVEVRVDPSQVRQVIDGFGATWLSSGAANLTRRGDTAVPTQKLSGPEMEAEDTLSPSQKAMAVEALFKDTGINLGNVDDPEMFSSWPIDPSLAHGLYPAKINLYSNQQLRDLRDSNYQQYLDECAGMVVGWAKKWQKRWGYAPRYAMLFNEPTSGNRELRDRHSEKADREMADIVKRAGAALRHAGYDTTFVFPNQSTLTISTETTWRVLADPEARPYIGRIGYHEYPYRSELSSVKKILDRARLDGSYGELQARLNLRELAAAYGIPLWMTEVSHAAIEYTVNGVDADVRDFCLLLGRANHVQSEFVVAGASAFFGMNGVWSRRAHELHFPNEPSDMALTSEDDSLMIVDQKYHSAWLTGVSYAIGHYGRWITPGKTFRLEAASSDPLVRVTAFHDSAKDRVAVVLLNNASDAREVHITLQGATFRGRLGGEQSTLVAYWKPFTPSGSEGGNGIRLTLPALSVTTLADQWAKENGPGMPEVSAGPDQQLPANATSATLAGEVKGAQFHTWILVSGPGLAVIDQWSALNPTVSGLKPGEYVFRLFATNTAWQAASAAVRIRVGPPPAPSGSAGL